MYASDMYGGASVLMGSATEIFRSLDDFSSRHSAGLPERAAKRLHERIQAFRPKFESASAGRDADFQVVQFRLTALRVLQSEVTYLLADTEAAARNLVARAFLHLQRAIIADPIVRRSWQAGFEKNETSCERLGGTHLLLHGIWAFKAHSEGERTDLVLGEKLTLTPEVEGAAEALVLTEWKRVRDTADLSDKANEALRQAKLYGSGSLAGFELRTRRYLVLVSGARLEMPPDRREANVIYQHVNIAVDPSVPSRESKA